RPRHPPGAEGLQLQGHHRRVPALRLEGPVSARGRVQQRAEGPHVRQVEGPPRARLNRGSLYRRRGEMKARICLWAVAAAVILFLPGALLAGPPAIDFYKGKVIEYVVATSPGGGYDAYARLIG